jgi:hypothetical protein
MSDPCESVHSHPYVGSYYTGYIALRKNLVHCDTQSYRVVFINNTWQAQLIARIRCGDP